MASQTMFRSLVTFLSFPYKTFCAFVRRSFNIVFLPFSFFPHNITSSTQNSFYRNGTLWDSLHQKTHKFSGSISSQFYQLLCQKKSALHPDKPAAAAPTSENQWTRRAAMSLSRCNLYVLHLRLFGWHLRRCHR